MDIVFLLAGGLGLFLYGTEAMSKSIQRLAGGKLKGILRTLTTNRFIGVASGAIVTAVVQTSTVTTVMVVSFVNAGLMALPQAISIILGAHIGTTVTAQIIAFHIESIALPMVAIGAFVHFFAKRDVVRNVGKAVFAFGIIFFGLILMTQALDPLKDNATLHRILEMFGIHPVLGFLTGILITMLVQSSSVTSGITIALALSGIITFPEAVPLILGENIGTTVTANIIAMNGSRAAKQAARAHFVTNALGATLALLLLNPFMSLVRLISPDLDVARQIANAHTTFNILNTILFLPLIPMVIRLSDLLIFTKKKDEELYYLEESVLQDLDSALDQVQHALAEMLGITSTRLGYLLEGIRSSAEKRISHLQQSVEKLERYQSRVTEYLEQIGEKNPSQRESKRIASFVRILHEIERLNDYEEKMRDVLMRIQREGRKFNMTEVRELRGYSDDAIDLIDRTQFRLQTTIRKKDGEAIMEIYESLYAKKDELRNANRKRVESRKTMIATANYYDDMVTSLEEIAKKCRNIAVALIE